MKVLGIETSCDDTSAAVVKDFTEVLSNVVSSQLKIHSKYGGVIPELASRNHLENIEIVVKKALDKAKTKLDDIDGVSVTCGPGLVGSLLVGIEFAKALAFSKNIPLIGINHLHSHVYASLLEYPKIKPPCLCLVVSGGHTELVIWKGKDKFELIGKTRDDAAGEAFDKTAKLLKLPYPGGPEIEKKAFDFKGKPVIFPKAVMKDKSSDFSFSGLKTAVMNYIGKNKKVDKKKIADGVQKAITGAIVDKVIKASLENRIKKVILAGGVAANKYLKSELTLKCRENRIEIYIPSSAFCTDNAAMVACAGSFYLKNGKSSKWDLNAGPSLSFCDKT